jgi:predicted ABC-type ATPase
MTSPTINPTAPVCLVMAGPNGAGKTTFALASLPAVTAVRRFINADLIAAGLSPLAPQQQLMAASRLFLAEMDACIRRRENFAFETTLSGRGYLKLVQRLRREGWRVELIYLALPSAEMSRQRVAERVAHGGHAIDDADVARRFPRSLFNLLTAYACAVDSTLCYLNTGAAPELVFEQQGQERHIYHPELFAHLIHKAGL